MTFTIVLKYWIMHAYIVHGKNYRFTHKFLYAISEVFLKCINVIILNNCIFD